MRSCDVWEWHIGAGSDLLLLQYGAVYEAIYSIEKKPSVDKKNQLDVTHIRCYGT